MLFHANLNQPGFRWDGDQVWNPICKQQGPIIAGYYGEILGIRLLGCHAFFVSHVAGEELDFPLPFGWVRLEKASLLDALPSSSGLKNHTYQPFGTVHKSIRIRQENCYYALSGFNMHCIYCQTSSNLKITSQEVASGGNSNTYSNFFWPRPWNTNSYPNLFRINSKKYLKFIWI